MKTISYDPSKDELSVRFCGVEERPTKEVGRFKLWWDEEGNICAINIMAFSEESKAFMRNLKAIRLGGIWKGVEITDRDIRETRQELQRKLEDKW